METLWSPWRSKYIGTFKDEQEKSREECFLCVAASGKKPDNETYVVARRKHCFAVLNLYPYNNGHTLIAPYRHIGDLTELKQEELSEMCVLMQECVAALKEIYAPHGFNLGANLGRTSGAGLPDHLHFHVVPRWSGDTSFISTISDTKVVSIGIEETYNDLSKILSSK